MKRVMKYDDVREMTPEVLLELTQSHKYQTIKETFKDDIGSSTKLLVTEKEIEAMGETLKAVVFFVTPSIMRSAMALAREKGLLLQPIGWLENGN